MNKISFDKWQELDIQVGKIKEVERVKNTDKLYKLKVDIGKSQPIQIISGLVPYYKQEDLENKDIVVLVNLKEAEFAGKKSEGMLLCGENREGKVVLITPEKKIAPGSKIC
jgi:methionine--tRNA ligase beta chain